MRLLRHAAVAAGFPLCSLVLLLPAISDPQQSLGRDLGAPLLLTGPAAYNVLLLSTFVLGGWVFAQRSSDGAFDTEIYEIATPREAE